LLILFERKSSINIRPAIIIEIAFKIDIINSPPLHRKHKFQNPMIRNAIEIKTRLVIHNRSGKKRA
jgi:hypothetical protein